MKEQTGENYYDLSGKWFCKLRTPAGNLLSMQILVEQKDNLITGGINLNKELKNQKQLEKKKFILTGKLRSRIVMVNIESNEENSSGFVCEILEIINTNKLIGKAVWYSVTEKTTTSAEVEWTRMEG